MSVSSVCVPSVCSSCLLPFWETLQDQQQVGLMQTPFKLLLLPWLPWVPEHVGFCMCPLRVSSSHSPLGLLKVSPAGLQNQTFWSLIFPTQDPWAGDPEVGLRPLASWGEPPQL